MHDVSFEGLLGFQMSPCDFGAEKALQRLDFSKPSDNDFVLARNEFLRLAGAPNESLRLIII